MNVLEKIRDRAPLSHTLHRSVVISLKAYMNVYEKIRDQASLSHTLHGGVVVG
jgi:hypothetical protein